MYLLLSILLHLTILLSMLMIWIGHPKLQQQKPPSMYVPSYSYQEPRTAPQPVEKSQQKKQTEQSKTTATSSSAVQISHASQTDTRNSTKVTDAIHLVGDKKTVPKPLIKLLGKALAAHLVYPKIALDFRVQGVAFVGFTLHADGTLSNVQLVRSSHAGVLDNEAVRAVSAMSPIKGVGQYVNDPKPLVVGIIFN